MIARKAIRTLFYMFQIKRIQKISSIAQATNVAKLAAQLALANVFNDAINNRFERVVIIGLFQLEYGFDWVHVGCVYNEVVKLVVQVSLDAYRESARVHIRSTVVQLQANFFHKSSLVWRCTTTNSITWTRWAFLPNEFRSLFTCLQMSNQSKHARTNWLYSDRNKYEFWTEKQVSLNLNMKWNMLNVCGFQIIAI